MSRTDDASWDLASSVGATATMVAAGRAMANKDPNGLISDPFADPLVRAVGLDFFVKMMDGELDFSLLPNASPDRTQAIIDGMGVRTKYFDDYLLAAVQTGVRQVVILASGLDSRAYRLPWPDGTTVYELDQPEVIEFKSKTLAYLGARPKATRHTIPIALRNDWPKALLDGGFDATQPTAWIAEGLLIYLPPEAQDLLFDRLNELSAPGSRVATEHIEDVSMFSDERSQQIADRLKQYGHDFEMRDLIYHEERNDVVEYLEGKGWDVTVRKMRDAYADNGFEFPEDGAIAFFTEMSYLSAVKR